MSALVEIDHLVKRFGPITAVDGVSFSVARGEVLGFLGPNGAGKSTTMKMITGFLAPDAGTVRVGGDDVTERPIAVKRRLGYLPEGAPLYGDMTTLGFLSFVAEVRGLQGAAREERLRTVIEQVHIGEVLEQPIETLSKGFKRRVGLAQAILHDPEVLILDEPTDGLDPNQKHEVRALIREMAPRKAIILSTHILEEVEAVCTRAVIIAGGRVVSDGTPAELEALSPRHNAVVAVLRGVGAAPARDRLLAVEGVAEVLELEVPGRPDGEIRLLVRPRDGASIVAEVGAAARGEGYEVVELYVERGGLDEVFRSITTGAGRT